MISKMLTNSVLLLDRTNNQYKQLTVPDNEFHYIKAKCLRCHNIFTTEKTTLRYTPNACPVCNKIGYSSTYEKRFMDKFKINFGQDYKILTPYVNSKIPILIRHKECGKIRNISPGNIKKGPLCNNKDCRKKRKEANTNGINVRTFAMVSEKNGLILLKKKSKNGKYHKFCHNDNELTMIRCQKKHRFHISKDIDYTFNYQDDVFCPICKAMDNDEYKLFEMRTTKRLMRTLDIEYFSHNPNEEYIEDERELS